MGTFIQNLKKKPKTIRNKYAFFGAIGITFVIAMFWATSFSVRFESKLVESQYKVTDNLYSFVDEIKNYAGTFFSNGVVRSTDDLRVVGTSTYSDSINESTDQEAFTFKSYISSSTRSTATTSRRKVEEKVILISTTTSKIGN